MKLLDIDFETHSKADLKKVGLDVYSRDPSTKVLMMAYRYDAGDGLEPGPPKLWYPHQGPMPAKLRAALTDPSIRKVAHNAQFEIAILRNVLGIDATPQQWYCTMVCALHLGLPGKLEYLVRDALKLDRKYWKDAEGDKLMRMFSFPSSKATHSTHPGEFLRYGEYCRQDVVAEAKVFKILRRYITDLGPLFDAWCLDQRINARGLPVDMEFIESAQALAAQSKQEYKDDLIARTGLQNPNSTKQMLGWLQERGYPFESLAKNRVKIALKDFAKEIHKEAAEVLRIRLESNKTSLAKFEALKRASWRGRLRGTYQFRGAAATGRYAGRILGQNMPRPDGNVEDYLAEARDMIAKRQLDDIKFFFGKPLEVLSSSIRSAIAAPKGKKLVVADLSSIELCTIAWWTHCGFWLDVVESGKDAYKAFAEQWLGVPYDKVTKPQRSLSKPPALGCFAGDTEILTKRGWVQIIDVRADDQVFDGVEFVAHGGVINQGVKHTIDLYGVAVTPEHEILCGGTWHRSDEVAASTSLAARARLSGFGHRLREPHRVGARFTYDILNCGPRNRFVVRTRVGPMIAHNCGYRMGAGREVGVFPDTEKTGLWGYAANMGVAMSKAECKAAVKIYRDLSPEIVQAWHDVENAAMECVLTGEPRRAGMLSFDLKSPFLRMRLPSGRYVHYCRPRIEEVEIEYEVEDEETGEIEVVKSMKLGMTYERLSQGSGKWVRRSQHGGRFAEQCLSADSLILTPCGPKRIVDVQPDDMLWDGVEWVSHSGLVFKGEKETIDFGGVRLTADHLIDVDGQWRQAGDVQFREAASSFSRSYGADIWSPNRRRVLRQRGSEVTLESALCVRDDEKSRVIRSDSGLVLRVQDGRSDKRSDQYAPNDATPCVHNVAFDEGALLQPQTPVLRSVRRAGDYCLRALGGLVRGFLVRYGRQLFRRSRDRPEEQRSRVQQVELQVGDTAAEHAQHQVQHRDRYAERPDVGVRSGRSIGHSLQHDSVSSAERLPDCEAVRRTETVEQVFDLKNAGPRHRFTVVAPDGQMFLAHNCTQAIALDVLQAGIEAAEAAGLCPIGHYHDEILCLVDEDRVGALEELKECMTRLKPWMHGLTLRAAGYEAPFYKKE